MPKQRSSATEGERLQKVLAAAGFGSRRECETLILEGRVEVDRTLVTELGTRVNPDQQEVRVDGDPLKLRRRTYYAINKPAGVVSTNRDPQGRPRVVDLVPSQDRLFTVGRLDIASEGLILVTNDGEWANRLTHPRYGVHKTYVVRVAGTPSVEELRVLKRGVHLAEAVARVENVKIKKRHGRSTDLEIVLKEGRNREIRRLLARVGHKVLTLTRVAVGTYKLGDLPSGAYRKLTVSEAKKLLELTHSQSTKPTKKRRRAKKRATGSDSANRNQQASTSQTPRVQTPRAGTIIGSIDEAAPAKEAPRKTSRRKPAQKKTSRRNRSR
ncbi:MAG TPA: pseudouridine synthase [Planctomycetaceae bacterium]|nr:hypothetical protein [Blastopirellula sp.]HAY80414.1 pseudouridine synthase [Planctomycetaceae bacterium]|tara:strand:- start:129 stop:1106 length:978 start_codon:yes stop_codon:yes gene_type:complete